VENAGEGGSSCAGDNRGPSLQHDGDNLQPRDGDDDVHDVAKGQGDGTAHDVVAEQCHEV
jgi:hypothetical protein